VGERLPAPRHLPTACRCGPAFHPGGGGRRLRHCDYAAHVSLRQHPATHETTALMLENQLGVTARASACCGHRRGHSGALMAESSPAKRARCWPADTEPWTETPAAKRRRNDCHGIGAPRRGGGNPGRRSPPFDLILANISHRQPRWGYAQRARRLPGYSFVLFSSFYEDLACSRLKPPSTTYLRYQRHACLKALG
jgi:hypothetical protein